MPVTTTCAHLIWRIQRCAEDLREYDARRNDFRGAVANELATIATKLTVELAYAPGPRETARLRTVEKWAREYLAHEDSPMGDVNDQTHALQQLRATLALR